MKEFKPWQYHATAYLTRERTRDVRIMLRSRSLSLLAKIAMPLKSPTLFAHPAVSTVEDW